MARRKRYLFVCVNRRPDGTPKGSCAARGGEELQTLLKQGLKEAGLAEHEVRACTSSCLDVCWVGPTIAVLPDGYFYGRVQKADLPELISALGRGERVERLVLSDQDFQEPREVRTAPPKLT